LVSSLTPAESARGLERSSRVKVRLAARLSDLRHDYPDRELFSAARDV